MTILESVSPHAALPHWSAFAIATGVIIGFLFGALFSALFALWLERQRQATDPLRHFVHRPNPAEKLPPQGTILYPMPPVPRLRTGFGPTEVPHG